MHDIYFVLLMLSRDDQILFNGIIFYVGSQILPGGSNLPSWRTDGIIITALLHSSVVEFLYYWLHRALHHHFLYSRYHSHHHSSIVTEPITCKPTNSIFLLKIWSHAKFEIEIYNLCYYYYSILFFFIKYLFFFFCILIIYTLFVCTFIYVIIFTLQT